MSIQCSFTWCCLGFILSILLACTLAPLAVVSTEIFCIQQQIIRLDLRWPFHLSWPLVHIILSLPSAFFVLSGDYTASQQLGQHNRGGRFARAFAHGINCHQEKGILLYGNKLVKATLAFLYNLWQFWETKKKDCAWNEKSVFELLNATVFLFSDFSSDGLLRREGY